MEQQQATIEQLLPSRRRVLQAGGLVAGGGVLGALTADRASAQASGQVGTSADRVDVFAGAVDANSVNTATVDYNGVVPDYPFLYTSYTKETTAQTTSSTSNTKVLSLQGNLRNEIPDGMVLYGRFIQRVGIDDSAETVTALPRVFDRATGTGAELTELAVSHTGNTISTTVDSGWVEISSSVGDLPLLTGVQGRVSNSNATGTFVPSDTTLQFAGVSQ